MGLFDKALKTTKRFGNSVTDTMLNVGSSIGTSAQDNSELTALKMEINTIEQELNVAYLQIGKRYIEHIIQKQIGTIDLTDIMTMLEPKLLRKQELEVKLIEVEKRMKQNDILREKAMAQQKFDAEKAKLDKALGLDIITQNEYNVRLAIAQKHLDNFEQIRKIEQQYDIGIITKEERDEQIMLLS